MSIPFDEGLGGIFSELQRFQAQIAEAEQVAAASDVVGTAGGGAVKIHASGEFSFDRVEIDPTVLEGADVTMLEDLVLAAVRDATSRLMAVRRQAMGQAMGGALSALLGGESLEDEDDEDESGEDNLDSPSPA